MLPPITIPELAPAGPIDFNQDELLLRQGLTDKRVTAGQLTNLRLEAFSPLNSAIISSDVILVGRNDGGGNYINYRATPQSLGFLVDNGGYPTVMWFFMQVAPLGWTVVPTTGDKVLATALPGGQSYQYTTPGFQGTWQQENTSLTITQIPSHSHYMDTGIFSPIGQSTSSSKVANAQNAAIHTRYVPSFPTGGNGSTQQTSSGNNLAPNNSLPAADGHNHGSTWRPAAAVGIICQKVQ